MRTYPFTDVLWAMSTCTSPCGHSFVIRSACVYSERTSHKLFSFIFTLNIWRVQHCINQDWWLTYTYNPSIWEVEAEGSRSSRSSLARNQIWGHLGSMRPCLTNSGISFLPGVIPTYCPSEQTTFPECSWHAVHLPLCADTPVCMPRPLEGHQLSSCSTHRSGDECLSVCWGSCFLLQSLRRKFSLHTFQDMFWDTWSRNN